MAKIVRHITDQDLKNAERFRKQWQKAKDALKLTQASAAESLGWSQPTFNQYLNGIIALNTDAIIALAGLMRCRPEDIDPGFSKRIALIPQRICVLSTTTRKKPRMTMLEVQRKKVYEASYGIEFDCKCLSDFVPQGTILICSSVALMKPQDLVLIQTIEGFMPVVLLKLDNEVITYCDIPYPTNYKHPKKQRLDSIISVHKITGYELP